MFSITELFVVEVESSDPTVSCEPVAEIPVPLAFDVMMELAGNEPAAYICEARVEVDTVCTRPLVPV